jgi:hypothetical protein
MPLRCVATRRTPGFIIEEINRANVTQARPETIINTTPQLNPENPQPMLEADIQVEHDELSNQERGQDQQVMNIINIEHKTHHLSLNIEQVTRSLSNIAITEEKTTDQLLAMPVNEQLQMVRSSAVKEPTLENYMNRIKKI